MQRLVRYSETDWEGNDEDFADDGEEDGDDDVTISCPRCGEEIHEDAQRCPYCENYLSEEDAVPGRKPWWIILGTLACLYAIYRWIAM